MGDTSKEIQEALDEANKVIAELQKESKAIDKDLAEMQGAIELLGMKEGVERGDGDPSTLMEYQEKIMDEVLQEQVANEGATADPTQNKDASPMQRIPNMGLSKRGKKI